MTSQTAKRVAQAAALVLLGLPLRSLAIFGVGDVVYDPANVAQTINVLHGVQQQLDFLGRMLGVSTQQFDQLVALAAIAGNPAGSAASATPASPARMQSLVNAIPGLQTADAGGLINAAGQLDAFLGVPLASWATAIQHPIDFYRNALVAPAVERAGLAAGLDSTTVAYAQWYDQESGEDRYNGASRTASDFAQLMSSDWLETARQRRVNLQLLAASGQTAEAAAGSARTQSDQQAAQTQLAANANRILLEAATQSAGAAEAQLRTAGAQQALAEEQRDDRRNAAEMALDGSD